jgi:hypothetical protein
MRQPPVFLHFRGNPMPSKGQLPGRAGDEVRALRGVMPTERTKGGDSADSREYCVVEILSGKHRLKGVLMKKFGTLILGSVLILAAGFILTQPLVHAFAIQIKCAKCTTDSGCVGVVVNEDGRPRGCSKKWFQDACTGTCEKICSGSTATGWCKWTPGDSVCQTDTGAQINCGTQTSQPCTGVWSARCTCSGTVTTLGTCWVNYCEE